MLKRAISLAVITLLFLCEASGQSGRFAYIGQYQYTGTSGKATIQLPSNASYERARLLELFVSCPDAACTVTFTIGSGLATATAGTFYRLRSETPATSPVKLYTASDATGGTALPAVPLPSGWVGTLEVKDIELLRGEAVSITVASSSQVVTLMPKVEIF